MRGFRKSILSFGFSAASLQFFLFFLAVMALPVKAIGLPRMESSWSANPVRPGKDFRLTVTARWKGDADLYVIKTPKIEFSDKILNESVSSKSYRDGEENVVSYSWTLVAKEKGRFEPFPIKMTVLSLTEPKGMEKELSTDPLVVDVARWHGLPVRWIILSSAIGLTFLGMLGWIIRKKRNRPPVTDPLTQETDPVRLLGKLKEELNTCRVRGDTLAFLETVQRIHGLVLPGEETASREIASLLDQARYGSLRLSGEEMERWARKYKKLELSSDDNGNESVMHNGKKEV